MRIVWLFETVAENPGSGVRVLQDAELLAARGHEVLVLSREAAPRWYQQGASTFRQVPSFEAATIPDCDVVIATRATQVSDALAAGRGRVVHLVEEPEPLTHADPTRRSAAERAFRLPVPRIASSPHVAEWLRTFVGAADVEEIVFAIDPGTMFPGAEQMPGRELRVGLVGPWEFAWKGIRNGVEACRIALGDGLTLRLVRISDGEPCDEERSLGVPTEWHVGVPPTRMGEIYRGLDVLLATATGPEEGFFAPALEAMACGVPTVLTDVPCFRGYAPGRTDYGLFVDADDARGMAQAIALLGAHRQLRRQVRAAGLEVARRYDPKVRVGQLEAALERVAGCEVTPQGVQPEVEQRFEGERGDPELDTLVAALLERGDRLVQDERFEEATAAFRAASCLAPSNREVRDRLGSAAFLAGDETTALRVFDGLAAELPHDRVAHEKRGLVLAGLDRWDEAARAFERATREQGAEAETFNSLGVALHELGDLAGARAAFEEALRRDPRHGDAKRNLHAVPVIARG